METTGSERRTTRRTASNHTLRRVQPQMAEDVGHELRRGSCNVPGPCRIDRRAGWDADHDRASPIRLWHADADRRAVAEIRGEGSRRAPEHDLFAIEEVELAQAASFAGAGLKHLE